MSKASSLLVKLGQSLGENLGNLKAIHKDLLSLFKSSPHYKQKSKLMKGFGQNSPLQQQVFKNAAAIDRALREPEDKKTFTPMGLLLSIKGKQIIGVVLATASVRALGQKVPVEVRFNFPLIFKILNPTAAEELFALVQKRLGTNHYIERRTIGTVSLSSSQFYGILTAIFGGLKAHRPEFILIGRDKEADKLAASREKAKRGSVLDPTLTARRFHRQLLGRLDAFKASRADAFLNPKQLLQAIIKNGYMEKVVLDGFNYSLVSDRISLGALKGEGWGGAYVEYRLDESGKKYKEVSKAFSLAYDAENDAEARKTLRAQMLPFADFKVTLQFDGGKIVPAKVVMGKLSW